MPVKLGQIRAQTDIFFRLIKSRHCFHMVTQLMLQGTCLLNGAAHLGGAIGGEPILQLHCLKFGAFPQKPCIPAHHQAAEGQDQRGPRVLLLPESIDRLELVGVPEVREEADAQNARGGQHKRDRAMLFPAKPGPRAKGEESPDQQFGPIHQPAVKLDETGRRRYDEKYGGHRQNAHEKCGGAQKPPVPGVPA